MSLLNLDNTISKETSLSTYEPGHNINIQQLRLKDQPTKSVNKCGLCKIQVPSKSNQFCKVCGKVVCNDCSKRQVNNQSACDLCFLRYIVQGDQNFMKPKEGQLKKTKLKIQESEQYLLQLDIQKQTYYMQTQEFTKQQIEEINTVENQIADIQNQIEQLQQTIVDDKVIVKKNEEQLKDNQQQFRQLEQKNQTMNIEINCKKLTVQVKRQELMNLQKICAQMQIEQGEETNTGQQKEKILQRLSSDSSIKQKHDIKDSIEGDKHDKESTKSISRGQESDKNLQNKAVQLMDTNDTQSKGCNIF